MLKRHLQSRHGLSVIQYKVRWNLSSDYPMMAPTIPSSGPTRQKHWAWSRTGTNGDNTRSGTGYDNREAGSPPRRRQGQ